MMLLINGEQAEATGLTVLKYLESENRDPAHVAVMINGEILPKAKYGETVLEDGYEVEIIGFVGGG